MRTCLKRMKIFELPDQHNQMPKMRKGEHRGDLFPLHPREQEAEWILDLSNLRLRLICLVLFFIGDFGITALKIGDQMNTLSWAFSLGIISSVYFFGMLQK